MKPKHVKKLLLSEIKSVADRFNEFCVKSGKFLHLNALPDNDEFDIDISHLI